MPEISTHTTTHTTNRVYLNREDILNFLQPFIKDVPPHTIKVSVRIPGGGDWSDTQLEINNEHLIVLEWETHS